MSITHLASSLYVDATTWNQSNFFLPDDPILGEIIKRLPVIDQKAFACTSKKVHKFIILGRLEKYEKIQNLIFHQMHLSTFIEDIDLFDNNFKENIKLLNADIQHKYEKILNFLLERKVHFCDSQNQIKHWDAPLFRWITLLKDHDWADEVFEFLIDFGFPVKNLAKFRTDQPFIIFETLLYQPKKIIKLIEAGTQLKDCQKIFENAKKSLQECIERALSDDQFLPLEDKLKVIMKLESYLQDFKERGQKKPLRI